MSAVNGILHGELKGGEALLNQLCHLGVFLLHDVLVKANGKGTLVHKGLHGRDQLAHVLCAELLCLDPIWVEEDLADLDGARVDHYANKLPKKRRENRFRKEGEDTWDDGALEDLLQRVDASGDGLELSLHLGALSADELNRILNRRQDNLTQK